MHQGIAYPPGPSGMPAGVPSGMYQPAPYMPMPQQQQNEQLRLFWLQQNQEIQQVGTDPAEFKNHQLPLARIKKVGARLQAFHVQHIVLIEYMVLVLTHARG